ncbi:MAG: TetR/AcrR family transcriptional regulator [bacterium]|nr:TetR/AcrR family transcriptional regulator [bacterium]
MTTPPPFSPRQHKTRLAFMNALMRLVAAHGFDSVTVTDIAHEARYGRWTFYQYFTSKEDAAYQTFLTWMADLDRQVIRAVEGMESPRREYESWRVIVRACQGQRAFLMRLNAARLSAWREQAKEFLIAQFLTHMLAGRFALIDGVRPEISARLYVTGLLELIEYAWRTSAGDDPALMEALIDELFVFIFKQAPPRPAAR